VEVLIREGKGKQPTWVDFKTFLGLVGTKKQKAITQPSLFDEDDFKKWWNLYNKKTTRKQTIEFWKKNIKPDLVETIMNHTKKYVKAREDKSKRKDPIRYLRDEAYYDEIIEYKNPEKKIDLDELYPYDTSGFSRKGRCSACGGVVLGNKFTIHKDDSDCCKAKINQYR
tara:strand:+ start:2108 stop:2614 length:507 start_codon:yes stop_codon:yes gene_type:complete